MTNNNFNLSAIAAEIYSACCDMDYMDYEDTKERDVATLEAALQEIELLSQGGDRERCHNFKALLSALSMAFRID